MTINQPTPEVLRITNALEAEIYTREKCRLLFGRHDTDWCRSFFSINFPRLLNCQMGKILMGKQPPYGIKERPYYYTPTPF